MHFQLISVGNSVGTSIIPKCYPCDTEAGMWRNAQELEGEERLERGL